MLWNDYPGAVWNKTVAKPSWLEAFVLLLGGLESYEIVRIRGWLLVQLLVARAQGPLSD